jgi:hypothetical protein
VTRVVCQSDQTKQGAINSTLPSHVPALTGRNSVSQRYEEVGFDAEQRVVRTLAAITRIVPNLGILLTPENSDHAAAKIKDQTGRCSGK